MTHLQRSLVAISIVLVVLLAALILLSIANQVDSGPEPDAASVFDPVSAHEFMREMVTQFPERAMGTEQSKAAADWIAEKMQALGLRTEQQEFSGWVHGERAQGRNVIGIDDGVRENMVVVLAHYDIPFHVREGAMDDASGVGVLLELARVFMSEEQEKTLVFIATDGEEWGMLGARHYVQAHPAPEKLFAAVSLDYVRVEGPEKVYLAGEGQFKGFAPLWLWTLAEESVRAAGGEPFPPSPLMMYVDHAVNISSTDQGPFLAAGIPGINLGGNKSDSPLAREIYHTLDDTHENFNPELFAIYGPAAEILVRSLDILTYIPEDERYFVRLPNNSYIGRGGVFTLQIFLFLPLLLATAFHYYNLRTKERFLNLVLAEVANYALFLLPWVLAGVTICAMAAINYIPKFELYPATPLDPFLYTPHRGAIGVTAAVLAALWGLVYLVRRTPALRRPDFSVSKAVGLDILLTLSLVALLLNGFAASLFLAPPALLLIWLGKGRSPWRILLNLVLVLTTAIPFVVLLVQFSSNLRLGWFVLWYLYLGVAYRFFSPIAVLIAVGALTITGRLVQQSLRDKSPIVEVEAQEDELLETQT